MRKIFTLFAAMLLCVGMNADPLMFVLADSALPEGTPGLILVTGSFGSQRMIHQSQAQWLSEMTTVDDLVDATADDTFGFRYGKKVLCEQIAGIWKPVERRVGDYWFDAGGIQLISFDVDTKSVWDASKFAWIDAEPIENIGAIEFEVPAEWQGKRERVEPAYFPELVPITLDEAKELEVPEEGRVFLIYGFNMSGKLMYALFNEGQFYEADEIHFDCSGIYANAYLNPTTYTFCITGYVEETAIDNTAVDAKATKRIENGQIVILRGDKTYTTTGQEVK